MEIRLWKFRKTFLINLWISIFLLLIYNDNMAEIKDKKTRFLEIYSNLPIKLRDEIVLVLGEKGPISWNVSYIEVKNDTKLGEEILNKLDKLKII